jgi:phage baseplate assembly protein gpV
VGADIRVGRVSSTNADKHTAQVKFFEIDSWISYDLQVLVTRPGDYSLPDDDAPVLCLMFDGHQQGIAGVGVVVGALYTDSDAPPLSDKGKRSIVSDDLRLGAADASDKVALAPKVKSNFDDLKTHFQAVEAVISGAPIPEPGNGANSAFQAALSAAIAAQAYPTPQDPAAEKVSAK